MLKSCIDLISGKLPGGEYSHSSSWAFLRANQLKHIGKEVVVLNEKHHGLKTDWSEYDEVYLYHTMNFDPKNPTLNLFGGPNEEAAKFFERLILPQHDHIKFISLDFPMPDYGSMCKSRIDKASDKALENIDPYWKNMNWDKVSEKCKSLSNSNWILDPGVTDLTYNKNDYCIHNKDFSDAVLTYKWNRLAIGDSHTHSAYIPESLVLRKDKRTLKGVLKKSIKKEIEDYGFDSNQIKSLICYWGNIDIRHHLCRESNPIQATKDLLKLYFDQLKSMEKDIEIVCPLPIEDESRKLPGSGYFEGTPFFGSREKRQELVEIFKNEIGNECNKNGWSTYVWPKEWYEMDGVEFMTTHMERPKSVHLARKSYRWNLVNDIENHITPIITKKSLFEF